MTDDKEFTEEFAWVRQLCEDTPAAPEAIDRAVTAVVAEVRRTASAPDNTAPTQGHRHIARMPRTSRIPRTPWMRWTPWIALGAALCVLIAMGEQFRKNAQTARKTVATLSETHPLAAPAPTPTTALPPSNTHEPSPPLTAAPFSTIHAHRPTVATVPHTPDGDVAPSHLTTPSQQAAVVPPVAPSLSPSLSPSQRQAVAGLDSPSATVVLGILDSAQTHDLPTERVVTRIHEGVHRGVPPEEIIAVTRNYVASLANARTTLGPSSTNAELQAGAEALLAGAPPSTLKQLRTARPKGSLVESLITLADLCTHGVAPLQASMALATLVAHDESDMRVRALRTNVIADIIRGAVPNAALAYRARQSETTNGFKSPGGSVNSNSAP